MEEKKNEEGKLSKPIKNSSEQDLEKPILWVFFYFPTLDHHGTKLYNNAVVYSCP